MSEISKIIIYGSEAVVEVAGSRQRVTNAP